MQSPSRRFRHARAVAVGTVASLALLVACQASLPTDAQVAGMDAASAERTARQTALIGRGDTVYYTIDSVPVTEEQAKAVRPVDIASISVHKNDRLRERRIDIRTKLAQARLVRDTIEPSKAQPDSTVEIRFRESRGRGSVDSLRVGRVSNLSLGNEFTGIILIDGVRSNTAALNTLSTADILSVEVVKGPSAAAMYNDPAAANGVIIIKTRRAARDS